MTTMAEAIGDYSELYRFYIYLEHLNSSQTIPDQHKHNARIYYSSPYLQFLYSILTAENL